MKHSARRASFSREEFKWGFAPFKGDSKTKHSARRASFSREEFKWGFQGNIASAIAFACFASFKGGS